MRRHVRREPADVDLAAGAIQPNRSLGGGRLALELVIPNHLPRAPLGQEQHREETAKRGIGICPAGANGRDECLQTLALRRAASAPSSRVATVDDYAIDAIWVANGIGDSGGGSLGYPEQREPDRAGRGDDRLKVSHPPLQRQLLGISVGKTTPSLVEANEGVPLGKAFEPVTPDRALPVILEVRKQVAALTIGGPLPCLAHASRTPSDAAQKRISCSTVPRCYAQPLPHAERGARSEGLDARPRRTRAPTCANTRPRLPTARPYPSASSHTCSMGK
jgi:hypothetical protein